MQTIGERLEEARKKKGVSIREAAEATKIRGDYLQKFESNQFDIGLTEIYTRGFLRTYAAFLKVPPDRIMSDYAALGRGDVRPRQPSREIYGRMDISVASASEAADRAAPPPETPAAEPAAASRTQPRYPRGTGSSLPTGPDPAVVFKWLKIGGAIAAVIIVVLIIRALLTGSGSTATTRNAPAPAPTTTTATQPATMPAAPRRPVITLIASNPLHVTVQRKNPDESYGEKLFDGPLGRGESQTVAWPGPLYITATAAENLMIDVNGQRISFSAATGQRGIATGQLPPPPQSQQ